MKGKARDVIPSFITNSCQNITNHSQTRAAVTECKTIKMMEIRRDRHFTETNTFLANRQSESNTENPSWARGVGADMLGRNKDKNIKFKCQPSPRR